MGRRMRLFKEYATAPLPMDHPVKNMDDWRRIKSHYESSGNRFLDGWEANARRNAGEGNVISLSIPGAFDEPRQLLGEENLCYAYYDQPELVHEIQNTIGNTVLKILEKLVRHVRVDELMFHEDLAGKTGSLIGPDLMKTFLIPYYRCIIDLMKENGTTIFNVDTDGNIKTVMPSFIEAGVNVLSPFEAAAGMDIVKVREEFGSKLAIMGGIDKFILAGTKEQIDAELEYKIPPLMKTGGCMFSLDHRVIGGTSLENYRFYVGKVWEYLNSHPDG
jgi:uroporphyrinogen-III decarboxylase